MVYCGSGTETQLYPYLKNFSFDPMVYCGSGTETCSARLFTENFSRFYGLLRKRY